MAKKKITVPKQALPPPNQPGLTTAVDTQQAMQKLALGKRLNPHKLQRTGI
jgi:hypothetical protein